VTPRRELRATLARIGGAGRAARSAPHAQLLGTLAARIIRAALTGLRRIIREAAAELARINRAGLRLDALAGRPRRARARLVAATLARRHHRVERCC
jgi:hypothetical protein